MPGTVQLSNGALVTPSDMPDVPPIVAHTVHGQQEAIDGGKMDGWQLVVGCHPPHYKCISGLEPSQEPNLITLADQFAISDDYFSLADSPSWGGHVYAVTASMDNFLGDIPVSLPHKKSGPGWGCDSHHVTQWEPSGGGPLQTVPSCIPDPSLHEPHGGAFRKTPVAQVPSGAIMNGPEWSSTVLFVTWDDCGCFYDQVPPPRAPNGRQEGPRLPLLIISPYARPGYTDTTQATYASILAYTEQTFGLAPLNVNDLRAYEFGNAFNYAQPPLAPVRMVTRPIPRGDHIIKSQNNQDT